MNADDPRHGTYAGVIAHGRAQVPMCDPCNAARLRMNKGAALDRHRGTPRMTTLGEAAWQIVATWPRDQLRQATGIRVDKIIRYQNGGPDMRVHRRTRDRILGANSCHYWTPVGIQRRIMALSRIGWSMNALAVESGIHRDVLKRLWKRDAQFVRANVAEAVIATYDRLSMTTPPSGRSATRARREAETRGWPPPLAWDDIDDPNERPKGLHSTDTDIDPVVVDRILAGDWRLTCTPAEKTAVCERWAAGGGSLTELGRLTGWRVSRYYKVREVA